jgi:hypothetical protein
VTPTSVPGLRCVALINSAGAVVASFCYSSQITNYCWARQWDGAPSWVEMRWATSGFQNNAWSLSPTPTSTP